MPRVFLSYARPDQEIANAIASEMRENGSSVFGDDQALVSGDRFDNQTEQALDRADFVVLLLSENSSRSRWVEAELINALEQKKHVIPVLLDKNAKENYVWPLVANFPTIERTNADAPGTLARKVSNAILHAKPASAAILSRWKRWIIVGAILWSSFILLGSYFYYQRQVSYEQAILVRELASLANAQQQLLARDPGNQTLLRDLAINYERLGEVASRMGDKSRALQAYLDGKAIIMKLREASPSDASLQTELSRFEQRINELR